MNKTIKEKYVYKHLSECLKEELIVLYMMALKKEHDVLSYVLDEHSTFDGSDLSRDCIVKIITGGE